eukprot:CAMPEP_0184864160 /NCGR_PEP_ID=MMETSP0580-20130426/14064_1 /TAXON_ID=1118495 /ORGANISM="Dactyliosolen fragilissimus" /LENGTH=475 /DNA_ID=CAMNT_0027362843 /DNA_START=17 /DNA_END=1441 /DNA_ORIENTATION=+
MTQSETFLGRKQFGTNNTWRKCTKSLRRNRLILSLYLLILCFFKASEAFVFLSEGHQHHQQQQHHQRNSISRRQPFIHATSSEQIIMKSSSVDDAVVGKKGDELEDAYENEDADDSNSNNNSNDPKEIFHVFASFLRSQQSLLISQLEELDDSNQKFSYDAWGSFLGEDKDDIEEKLKNGGSGGITRVIQNGKVIEKGACSLTLIQNGKLTAERARSITGRQGNDAVDIKEGDTFSAAALSIVLHTRSPMVPTFRSDVRIFMVQTCTSQKEEKEGDNPQTKTLAWFGGGADLTPYYLFDEDISSFHKKYQTLCDSYFSETNDTDNDENDTDANIFTYSKMKNECDRYFYLPARSEHRGTGGIFFDDMSATNKTLAFVQGVANTWLPSWRPIVEKRHPIPYTDQQRNWQLLRRGRYLEFNLLYDRGVKFGLANANPRVEGVMVSAPPLIAWEYNHAIEPGSEEHRLMQILKNPKEW